ncbi:hypothetical protein BJS_03872 [Bradyrhizobium japonicum SEMIA 5079]|nr:hypothetical protein BJS_03872 [Bradyrhizobium japonicum SEMIA 5079]
MRGISLRVEIARVARADSDPSPVSPRCGDAPSAARGEGKSPVPPTLNCSQFAISPFVNRRTTLHNRPVLSSRRLSQKA